LRSDQGELPARMPRFSTSTGRALASTSVSLN